MIRIQLITFINSFVTRLLCMCACMFVLLNCYTQSTGDVLLIFSLTIGDRVNNSNV